MLWGAEVQGVTNFVPLGPGLSVIVTNQVTTNFVSLGPGLVENDPIYLTGGVTRAGLTVQTGTNASWDAATQTLTVPTNAASGGSSTGLSTVATEGYVEGDGSTGSPVRVTAALSNAVADASGAVLTNGTRAMGADLLLGGYAVSNAFALNFGDGQGTIRRDVGVLTILDVGLKHNSNVDMGSAVLNRDGNDARYAPIAHTGETAAAGHAGLGTGADIAAAGGLTDAPSNGNHYARRDGAWAQVSTNGGSGACTNALDAVLALGNNAGGQSITNAGGIEGADGRYVPDDNTIRDRAGVGCGWNRVAADFHMRWYYFSDDALGLSLAAPGVVDCGTNVVAAGRLTAGGADALTAESDTNALAQLTLHTNSTGNVHQFTGADIAAAGGLTNPAAFDTNGAATDAVNVYSGAVAAAVSGGAAWNAASNSVVYTNDVRLTNARPLSGTITLASVSDAGDMAQSNAATVLLPSTAISSAPWATNVSVNGTNYASVSGTITLPDYPAGGGGSGGSGGMSNLSIVTVGSGTVVTGLTASGTSGAITQLLGTATGPTGSGQGVWTNYYLNASNYVTMTCNDYTNILFLSVSNNIAVTNYFPLR
jgi:hypothetical protein